MRRNRITPGPKCEGRSSCSGGRLHGHCEGRLDRPRALAGGGHTTLLLNVLERQEVFVDLNCVVLWCAMVWCRVVSCGVMWCDVV